MAEDPRDIAPIPPGKGGFEREFKLGARVIAYVVGWLVCAFVLFRILVPMTWGARSDLAPLAAIVLAVAGALGLLYLFYLMVRDIRRAM